MISLYLLIIPVLILSYVLYSFLIPNQAIIQTQTPAIIYNRPTNPPSNIIIESMNRYINNVDADQTGDISIYCSSNDTIVNDDKISIKSLPSSSPNGAIFVRYASYGGDSSNKKLSLDPHIVSPTSKIDTVPMINAIIIDKMFFKVKSHIGYLSSFLWYDILDIGYIDITNSPQPVQTPSATFTP